jgi:hypothetical protein
MTSTANPISEDEAVMFAGRRWTVAFINYNAGSHECRTYCRRMDLRAADGTTRQGIRECELTAAPAGMVEGESIPCTVGAVEVVLLCVRPNAAYRVRVLNGGREVDELTRSYPTEVEARTVARSTVKLFNRGASVQLVLDSLEHAAVLLAQTPAPSDLAA